MACIRCEVGMHTWCPGLSGGMCCCASEPNAVVITRGERARKEDEDVKDIESTGRKRAAKEYPLEEGMLCEWSGLAKAGGGVFPIVGCIPDSGNLARARHHGPDKNTVNNNLGNVHRICHFCHNRWHTANDPEYPEQRPGTKPFVPTSSYQEHDGISRATPEELVKNEMMWASRKTKIADTEA